LLRQDHYSAPYQPVLPKILSPMNYLPSFSPFRLNNPFVTTKNNILLISFIYDYDCVSSFPAFGDVYTSMVVLYLLSQSRSLLNQFGELLVPPVDGISLCIECAVASVKKPSADSSNVVEGEFLSPFRE